MLNKMPRYVVYDFDFRCFDFAHICNLIKRIKS